MGMACDIQALTAGQIAALRADPDLALEIGMAHHDKKAETLLDEPLCEVLYLDKCWDILRFLLLRAGRETDRHDRKDWSSELLYGEEIGESTGYGEPCLRDIADTQEFAAFLQPLTLERLLSHFNCQEMLDENVYIVSESDVSDAEGERNLREYASHYFVHLREYALKAAASQCGLLLTIY
jgi:hypothetical protein